VFSALITGVSVLALNPGSGTAIAESQPRHAQVSPVDPLHPGFADMIESVRAAVVNISTTTSSARLPAGSRAPEQYQGHEFDEFMQRFFGAPGLRQGPPSQMPGGREKQMKLPSRSMMAPN